MKMSDVFKVRLLAIDNEEITGEDNPCLCNSSGGFYAVFNTTEQAEAAAHAINSHDKLEADKAALVDCVELVLDITDMEESLKYMLEITLNQVKGDL